MREVSLNSSLKKNGGNSTILGGADQSMNLKGSVQHGHKRVLAPPAISFQMESVN